MSSSEYTHACDALLITAQQDGKFTLDAMKALRHLVSQASKLKKVDLLDPQAISYALCAQLVHHCHVTVRRAF